MTTVKKKRELLIPAKAKLNPNKPQGKAKTIADYIREARRLIDPITKESDANMGRGGSWSFTSAEAMLSHCRDALNNVGILLSLKDEEVVDGIMFGEQMYPLVKSEWELECITTGEIRTYKRIFPVENLRTPLKGVCSVETTMWLYMLRSILMLPRLDPNQMEADSDPDGERTARDNEARRRDAKVTTAQLKEINDLGTRYPEVLLRAGDMCRKKYGGEFKGLSSQAATGLIDWMRSEGKRGEADG